MKMNIGTIVESARGAISVLMVIVLPWGGWQLNRMCNKDDDLERRIMVVERATESIPYIREVVAEIKIEQRTMANDIKDLLRRKAQ